MNQGIIKFRQVSFKFKVVQFKCCVNVARFPWFGLTGREPNKRVEGLGLRNTGARIQVLPYLQEAVSLYPNHVTSLRLSFLVLETVASTQHPTQGLLRG